MSLPGNTDPGAVTRPGVLKRFWGGFNRWRKRYFRVRLLFLLLLGGYVCLEAFYPVLSRLTRFAILYLEAGCEPSLMNAVARYKRVRLAHHLQLSLRHGLDKDGDGSLAPSELNRLPDLGLQPEELQKRSIDASLPQLIEACHRAGLLPTSYSVCTARREAWFAAVAEVEAMKRPVRAKIEAMLKQWEVPDYSRLETWKRGTSLFLKWVRIPLGMLGRPRTVLVWLMFCFFIGLMAGAFLRRGKSAKSLLLGGALAVPVILCSFFSSLFRTFMMPCDFWVICEPVGFLSLSMACAGYAGKIAGGERSRRFYLSSAAVGLGTVLLVWAFPRWLSGEALRPAELLGGWLPADRLLYLGIPGWVKDAAVGVGGASLVAGALALAGFRGLGSGKRRVVSSEAPEQQE